MKVLFKGVTERRTRGCRPCGKAKTELGFTSVKEYLLPSGIRKTFRKGRIEEVNDSDGAFLLQYEAFEKA